MKAGRLTALVALFLLLSEIVSAATVDTVVTHSVVMKKDIKAVIVRPADYSAGKKFPVVYLLHGYSGNYADWVRNTPEKGEVMRLSDLHHVIIVCPDGNFGSWYMDSPIDSSSRYETYLAKELVQYVDAHYSTDANRAGRAITGLSMGGHGALYLAFRHQDIFGACGSMSGGVDLRPFPNNWDLSKYLGKYSEHPENWERNSVVNLVYLLTPNSLAITIDCGRDDFFFTVNENLHRELLERNIPHDYSVRPGEHTWQFWGNAINYQMLFFARYFGHGGNGTKE